MDESTEILVIGGGPAGSTAATLLAREGFDVTLMEKEIFPRYHIGESLLPSCLPIFDLLGARKKLDTYGFQVKRGGYFDWGGEQWDLIFTNRLEGNNYGYQVLRSEFDQLLLEHAESEGVTVREGAEVKRLNSDGARPQSAIWSSTGRNVEHKENEMRFDFLVDASGRAGIMTTRYLRNRRHHKVFKNVATWGYWHGAKKLPASREGAIAICSVPDGWFWGIPLRDGRLSVGLVTHKETFKLKRQGGTNLEQIYLESLSECPVIPDLLTSAELVTSLRTEQDYSYTADRFTGPGYFVVGDAACFLDPLLSTGVHLATYSALLAAASLASILRGEVGEEEAQDLYQKTYQQAYLRLLVVVSTLYQHHRGKDSYFREAQRLTLHDCSADDLEQAFVSIVSGIEDLQDAQAGLELVLDIAGKAVIDEFRSNSTLPEGEAGELSQARKQFFHSAMDREDIGGLHLVTNPRIGLARQ